MIRMCLIAAMFACATHTELNWHGAECAKIQSQVLIL